MSKNARDNRPYIKPVTRIELPDGDFKKRWIAIAVLAAVALTALGSGLYALFSVEPGWHTVEVASKELNCSADFVFQYDFTGTGGSSTEILRQVTAVYQKAAEEAYQIFSAETAGEGNVQALNANVNEVISVDPALYRALEQVGEEQMAHLFLAPAMTEYNRVFLSSNDTEAAIADPTRNPEMIRWLNELAAFISDREQISLELLGENRARLRVGEGYLAFAEEYGIETFLDFGWLKNAFIADFLAQALLDSGFTRGYLASFDGFTRNLDNRGLDYTMNVYQRSGNDISLPARFHYDVPMALVSLRDFPQTARDRWHYYAYENGDVVTAFLDPRDGMSKTAVSTLLGYSAGKGCAEILLALIPAFVADEFSPAPLEQARMKGIDAVWTENGFLRHTDPGDVLERLPTA